MGAAAGLGRVLANKDRDVSLRLGKLGTCHESALVTV